MMAPRILQELTDQLAGRLDGRSVPGVRSIHPPPGGSSERTSPFTLVVLDEAETTLGLCYNLLETPDDTVRYDALDLKELAHSGDAMSLARRALSADAAERIVGYAACHALSQLIFRQEHNRSWRESDDDVVEMLAPRATDHVGLVGFAPPMVRRLVEAGAGKLTVAERPDRARALEHREDVVITTDASDLAACNKVLLTSTTLLNGTFDNLEVLTRGAQVRALYGPGASVLPDPVLARGIDAMAGLVVTDADALIDHQLGGRRWGRAKRKVLFVKV